MLSEFELPVSRRWVADIRSYASLGTILQLLAVTVAVGLLLYIIAGLWFGHAFVVIGLCISALALVGYFLVGDWFDLWMAFVDGGGLMLGGWWMRRS